MTVKRVTILLSRQPMLPSGRMGWVCKVVEAVRWVKSRKYVLYSSVGTPTWELITAVASLERVPLRLFLPVATQDEIASQIRYYLREFDLEPGLVEWEPVFKRKENAAKENLRLFRDRRIMESVDVLVPVSLRDKGYMSEALKQAKGKEIQNAFRIPYQRRVEPIAYTLSSEEINPELQGITDYVIHWTRTSNTAWYDERLLDYYASIITSLEYPRNGFHTLRKILSTRFIRASSKNMPGGIATVSFSGLSPLEMLPLMRWRARYRQMSFEPYGIGIEKTVAQAYGIQPVCYHTSPGKLPSRCPQWLWQSVGKRSDWRREKEYRFCGDVDLSHIPTKRLLAFCRTPEEAEHVEREFGINAVSFQKHHLFAERSLSDF